MSLIDRTKQYLNFYIKMLDIRLYDMLSAIFLWTQKL